jgi:hypothetical protein
MIVILVSVPAHGRRATGWYDDAPASARVTPVHPERYAQLHPRLSWRGVPPPLSTVTWPCVRQVSIGEKPGGTFYNKAAFFENENIGNDLEIQETSTAVPLAADFPGGCLPGRAGL